MRQAGSAASLGHGGENVRDTLMQDKKRSMRSKKVREGTGAPGASGGRGRDGPSQSCVGNGVGGDRGTGGNVTPIS